MSAEESHYRTFFAPLSRHNASDTHNSLSRESHPQVEVSGAARKVYSNCIKWDYTRVGCWLEVCLELTRIYELAGIIDRKWSRFSAAAAAAVTVTLFDYNSNQYLTIASQTTQNTNKKFN
jgi:hypothetical protein